MECCRNIWSSLTKYKVAQDRSRYVSFSPASGSSDTGDGVDVLLREMLANNKSFHQLWLVVQQVLLLSHGQATVERGFSVDKQMKTDNLACDTFEARRLVCDHVAVVGVIQNIDVKNKQLLSSCLNTRHRYRTFLEDQKKEQAKAASAGKRKAVNDEVDQLKKRNSTMSVW